MQEILKLENWRDIEGYEGLYQVSNLGRVRSLSGRWGKYKEPKILKARKDGYGYLQVDLCKDEKTKTFKLHRLVAQTFIENPLNLPQVNHVDEDKTNNYVCLENPELSNLEWCTNEYNHNYGTRNQRVAEKLSKAVISIDSEGNEEWFPSMHEAERLYGFKQQGICNCLKGRRKTHGGRTWRYA